MSMDFEDVARDYCDKYLPARRNKNCILELTNLLLKAEMDGMRLVIDEFKSINKVDYGDID